MNKLFTVITFFLYYSMNFMVLKKIIKTQSLTFLDYSNIFLFLIEFFAIVIYKLNGNKGVKPVTIEVIDIVKSLFKK